MTVVVPSECIDAARTINEAVALFRGGVDSVRDFQPEELVRLLNEVKDLDRQVSELAQKCATEGEISTP